ncbi:type IV secretion system protein VirB1 [Bartonella fuyuanensis]|uniref:Type IV secretion system protein VirB1 n=1 Tax=Bartonella fuyuanensis TaxID=1460968 RepID=A0A840DRT2_9HYPH|nr:hypothetical protein [Bartonella fuyuanensis]MBB4075774.1 type IV secretion system protein VirB1 [Bartonella fuyuanensis]
MIIPDFTMLSAAYIFDTPFTAFSILVGQELQSNIYVTDNDKLLRQSSPLEKTIATRGQFKQSKHNFDVNLEQIDVEDMKGFFLFNTFGFFRNLKTKQAVLAYRYEQVTSTSNSKKDILQSVLNFYNLGNLNRPYIQKISSFFGVKIPPFVDNKTSQESIEIYEREQEQTTKTESPLLSKEELEDAFTHKASSTRDAFATEGSSSLENNSSGG